MLLDATADLVLSAPAGQCLPMLWDAARTHGAWVVRQLLEIGWSKEACLNINFPPLPADECGPVTLADLRKVVIDVPGVHNAWIDLVDGAFYGGDPYPAFAWMRRWRCNSSGAATRTSPISSGLAAPRWSCGGLHWGHLPRAPMTWPASSAS